MKNYKSLAAAAAAVVLIVSSITGCSAAQAAANVRPAAETTQETASAQEKEDRNKPGDQLLALVNEGKLSQETYDAIQKYLEANRQEPPEGQDGKKGPASAPADGGRMPQERPAQGAGGTDGKNPAERPTDEAGGSAGKNPPEKPAGEAGGAAGKNPPEKQAGDAGRTGMDNGPLGMMISRDTLDKLLSGGVITQAEYDLIKEVIPEMPEMPEMPTEAKQF